MINLDILAKGIVRHKDATGIEVLLFDLKAPCVPVARGINLYPARRNSDSIPTTVSCSSGVRLFND